MRFAGTLFIVGLVLLAIGGQDVYVAMTNKEQTEMTCAQFLSSGSSAKWVALSECNLDWKHAVQLEDKTTKSDQGTYVPVLPMGQKWPASILLKIKSEDAAAKYQKWEANQMAETNETVEGTIKFGLSRDSKADKVLRELVGGGIVTSGYKMLESGLTPDKDKGKGTLLAGGGAVLALVGAVLFLRGRKSNA